MGLGGFAGTDPISQTIFLRSLGGSIMSWRRVPFVKGAVLAAAAFLLMAPQVLAGPATRAGSRTVTPPQPSPATAVRVAPPAITIALVVEPPRATTKPLTVGLRGPDGQVRRFPVEGGREAIQVRSVILRSGESVTILWTPMK
jgi:hypothetical protein